MDEQVDKKLPKKMTDEEIAKLLDENLDPEIRRVLVEKLENDPDSARVLALAASVTPSQVDGLSKTTMEGLLDTVKKYDGDTGLCPHCAMDLHDSGEFCPHCGLKVRGSKLNCLECGKPVIDGNLHCPHCGNMFGEIAHRPLLDSRWLMFLVGVISFVVAVVLGPGLPSVIFVLIGMISLLGWLTEYLGLRTRGTKRGTDRIVRRVKKPASEDKDESGRRSG